MPYNIAASDSPHKKHHNEWLAFKDKEYGLGGNILILDVPITSRGNNTTSSFEKFSKRHPSTITIVEREYETAKAMMRKNGPIVHLKNLNDFLKEFRNYRFQLIYMDYCGQVTGENLESLELTVKNGHLDLNKSIWAFTFQRRGVKNAHLKLDLHIRKLGKKYGFEASLLKHEFYKTDCSMLFMAYGIFKNPFHSDEISLRVPTSFNITKSESEEEYISSEEESEKEYISSEEESEEEYISFESEDESESGSDEESEDESETDIDETYDSSFRTVFNRGRKCGKCHEVGHRRDNCPKNNKIRFNIKKPQNVKRRYMHWTQDEKRALINHIYKIGTNWKVIALDPIFRNRSPTALASYWKNCMKN